MTKRNIEKRLDALDDEGSADSGVNIAFKHPKTGELYADEEYETPYTPPEDGVTVVWTPDERKW